MSCFVWMYWNVVLVCCCRVGGLGVGGLGFSLW